MDIYISPSRASGSVSAPPSKSIAHRLLILAAFSEGVSQISNLPLCEDVLATLDCLRVLGIEYRIEQNKITIYGKSIHALSPTAPLPCRESASTLRFLIPISLLTKKSITFSGSKRLLSRPMSTYRELFSALGWRYEANEGQITVEGADLPPSVTLRADESSQFVSGILLAYAISGKGGRIELCTATSSLPYIDLTMDALKKFGCAVNWLDERTLSVSPCTLSPICTYVEGDHSAAASLIAFNALGGEVFVEGLAEDSHQGDRIYQELFPLLEHKGARIDLDACPDLGPILFALAAAKNGAVFTSCARLCTKESDRVGAMAEELSKLGAELIVQGDEVEVISHPLHAPTSALSAHGDHRIVMALVPLLSLVGGAIEGFEATKKSFPDYLAHIRALGVDAKET